MHVSVNHLIWACFACRVLQRRVATDAAASSGVRMEAAKGVAGGCAEWLLSAQMLRGPQHCPTPPHGRWAFVLAWRGKWERICANIADATVELVLEQVLSCAEHVVWLC